VDREWRCVLWAEGKEQDNEAETIDGAGPGSVLIKIAAFFPGDWVGNPYLLPPVIFEGDSRDFTWSGGTSRQITLIEVFNPAVNDGGLVRPCVDNQPPCHSNVMSVMYDRDTSLTAPPFGTIKQEARDDWERGYPMKLDWRYPELGADGNSMMCTPPQRLGADFDAETSAHQFTCRATVRLPFVDGVPYIDSHFTVTLTYGHNQAKYTIKGWHDGFPSHEIWMNGQSAYQFSTDGHIEHLFGSGDVVVDRSGVIR
jgi:hypothetical protein